MAEGPKSEAFRFGYMGGSIDALQKLVREDIELRLVEEVWAVKSEQAGLQAQIDAYKQRAVECRARINALFGARSAEAPFVWLMEKSKLLILKRGLERLKKELEEIESRESSLRDRVAEETARLEVQVLLEYDKGKHFRVLTNKDSNHKEGNYDVKGFA